MQTKSGASKYIDKKMPTALIYTINNTPERYDLVNYGTILAPDQQDIQMMFGFHNTFIYDAEGIPCYKTWSMGAFVDKSNGIQKRVDDETIVWR